MPKYRDALPQLGDQVFLADGGMGTTLLFHEGLELPHFCSFQLLDDDNGREILYRYFRNYLALTRELGKGFIPRQWPDLARQCRLGRPARLRCARACAHQPRLHRDDGATTRRVRNARQPDRDQRLHGSARRRLRAGRTTVRTTRHRLTTPPRSKLSAPAKRTWSPR